MIVVEARGKSCPLPIVLLAKAARTASPGTPIVIRADDRAFQRDLEAWCARTGYRILELKPAAGYVEATLQSP
jgi:TusA-related sulfurtransferase